MLKKFYLLTFCSVLFISKLLAQVNLSSGGAQISLPLFNLSDSRTGLSANVALNYIDGNGLNPNEIASSVGTGWYLNVGGEISRTVVGEPDDQEYIGAENNPETSQLVDMNKQYYDGYLYTAYSPSDQIPGYGAQRLTVPSGQVIFGLGNGLRSPLKAAADRQQDIFTFSFNGRTGSFYIGKDRSILQTIDSKLKIQFTEQDLTAQGIRTRINGFTITDENGYIYTFSDMQVSYLMTYRANNGTGDHGLTDSWPTDPGFSVYDGHTVDLYFPTPSKVVNRWLLTSIQAPFTNDKIYFNYEDYSVDMKGAVHLQSLKNNDNNNFTYIMIRDRLDYIGKRLKKIVLPDNKLLYFNYTNLQRIDLPGDLALDNIQYVTNYNGTEKLNFYYQFSYGYFYKNEIKPFNFNWQSSLDQQFARLCLTSCQKISNDNTSLPPVSFEYYLQNPLSGGTAIVPPPFFLATDEGGFYTRDATTSGIQSQTDFHVAAFGATTKKYLSNLTAVLGVIKKITYSTGKSTEYEFEQNTSKESTDATNKFVPGIRVKNVINSDGNTKSILNYSYVLADGTTSGQGYQAAQHARSQNVRVFKSPDQVHSVGYQVQSSLLNSLPGFIKNLNVNVTTASQTWDAFGSFISNAIISYVLSEFISGFLYIITPAYQDYTYYTYQWDNINLSNPIPVIYSRVIHTEKSGDGSSNGQTIYQLYSYTENPVIQSSFAFPFTQRARFASWIYGLPKNIQIKDAAGNTIKDITNSYTMPVYTSTDNDFMSKNWDANRIGMTETGFNPLSSDLPTSLITSETYFPIHGFTELATNVEKTYDKAGNYVTQTTTYTYNANYQLTKTETYINSNKTYGKTFFYPADYDPTINYTSDLLAKNVLNEPVMTADWVNDNGTVYLTNAIVNKYSKLSNGEIKPNQLYSFESATPVANSFLTTFSKTTNPWSYSYLALQKTITYRNSGASDDGIALSTNDIGKIQSQITSFNGRFTDAIASNAQPNEIAFTSFESPYSGNWSYGAANSLDATALTGDYSYNLNAGAISTSSSLISLTPSKTYIVSYWSDNSSAYSVSGSQSVFKGKTVNGWNYYEHKVTGVSGVTVSWTSGNKRIDELRLYPITAQMKSFTYDPVFGLTSEDDVNSSIVYTEYDDLGRVRLIRNGDKNIVTQYCYNEFGQPMNCSGEIFTNDVQGQYFTRECPSGQVGSTNYITVPAGTFSSYISVPDANQKAIDYLNANGPSIENQTGTCAVPPNYTVTYGNSSSYQAYAYFTNKSTGIKYTYTLLNNKPNNTVASGSALPSGTYDVQINVSGAGSALFNLRVYDLIQMGVSSYLFKDVSITCSSCASISVDPH